MPHPCSSLAAPSADRPRVRYCGRSSMQATLASCGINPADTIGLHSNLGAMLPLDHHVKDRHHWRPLQDWVDAHLQTTHLRKPGLPQVWYC